MNLLIKKKRLMNTLKQENRKITFTEYAESLISVFGKEKAIPSLLFFISSIFRPIIVNKLNLFPILNFSGPAATGKTEMAYSLLALTPNSEIAITICLHTASKNHIDNLLSMPDKLLIHIDEYLNDIDAEKIMLLKWMYHNIDTYGNGNKDLNPNAIKNSVILSGQEIPTSDLSLFNKLIHIPCDPISGFTSKEIETFKAFTKQRSDENPHGSAQPKGKYREHVWKSNGMRPILYSKYVGKRAAGDILDNKQHKEFPKI
jgi:hypothetical protein